MNRGETSQQVDADRLAGRWIGGLMLAQLIAGVATLQFLTAPLIEDGGYLVNAAGHTLQLGISVLVTLAGACVTLVIGVLGYRVFQARGELLGLCFLVFSVVGAALSAVEQVGVLAMVEFSEAYRSADTAAQAVFEQLRAAGSLLRNGAHYVSLLTYGATMFMWYLGLLRFRLVPRLLPALGLLAVALQLFAISQPVLGGDVPFVLLAPIGLAQILTALWLLVFGFRDPAPATIEGD